MTILFCDLETYSPVPLQNGTWAYAEPSEILLFAYAIDDEPPKCWDLTAGEPMPEDLRVLYYNPDILTVWHNGGMFDSVILRLASNSPGELPVRRIHDTMVRAMSCSLPGSLDALGGIMKLDMRKDKRGKQLMNLFCKPLAKNRKLARATRKTHPEKWEEFKEYAMADIPPMRELYKKLPRRNYEGMELELWYLDQESNSAGLCIDMDLVHAAIAAVDKEQKRLAKNIKEITEDKVSSATQRDALLEYIMVQYDLELPDLRKSTIEKLLDTVDLPKAVADLLRIRLDASTTSTAKYKRLLKGVSQDGYLRGTEQFNGAKRTGRKAGRLFQHQNLPRSTMKQKEIEFGIAALKAGCADLLY